LSCSEALGSHAQKHGAVPGASSGAVGLSAAGTTTAAGRTGGRSTGGGGSGSGVAASAGLSIGTVANGTTLATSGGGGVSGRGGGECDPRDGEDGETHDHDFPFGLASAGFLSSRAFTAFTRACAQSRRLASGLLLATASYALSAGFSCSSSSCASPRPAIAR